MTPHEYAQQLVRDRDAEAHRNLHGRTIIVDIADVEPYFQRAIEEERRRCAALVSAWANFEQQEGGTRICFVCRAAFDIAAAILDPALEPDIERKRSVYLANKPRTS